MWTGDWATLPPSRTMVSMTRMMAAVAAADEADAEGWPNGAADGIGTD